MQKLAKKTVFYIIEKTWNTGDKLNISFVNEIIPVAANNDEITLQRGAIVYALEIPHRKEVTKKYEIEGFRDYMVFSTDDLYKNVQLKKTPEDNSFGFEFIKGADSSNPWYNGNSHLTGEVYNKELEKLVKVKLVPMGGTTLRRVTFQVK